MDRRTLRLMSIAPSREFVKTLRDLAEPTPCRDNPDAWANPSTPRVKQRSAASCRAYCPIVEQCLAEGVRRLESGIYGGEELEDGDIVTEAPTKPLAPLPPRPAFKPTPRNARPPEIPPVFAEAWLADNNSRDFVAV